MFTLWIVLMGLATVGAAAAAAAAPQHDAAAMSSPAAQHHADSAPAPNVALRQERRSMRLDLRAPAREAFPLFGPVREGEWVPGWEPRFAAPSPPAQGPDGAVFTTQGHGGDNTWVMTAYDSIEHHVAYVMLKPDHFVVEIDIHVAPAGDKSCTAEVGYRYTALSEDGNRFIEHWVQHWPDEAPHWTNAINGRLASLGWSATR
jgi:hypothetical protein